MERYTGRDSLRTGMAPGDRCPGMGDRPLSKMPNGYLSGCFLCGSKPFFR